MRVFPGVQLSAVLLILYKLSVLAEGKTLNSILNGILVLQFRQRIAKLSDSRISARTDLIKCIFFTLSYFM